MLRVRRPDDRRALVVIAFRAIGAEHDHRVRIARADFANGDVEVVGRRFPDAIRRGTRRVAATPAAGCERTAGALAGIDPLTCGLGDAAAKWGAVDLAGEAGSR